jgi:hypothetical protein
VRRTVKLEVTRIWRKVHNKELWNLYSSSDFMVTKSVWQRSTEMLHE